MASYLLLEDGSKLLLEDGSGAVLIEDVIATSYWDGSIGNEKGDIAPDSYQVGPDSYQVGPLTRW